MTELRNNDFGLEVAKGNINATTYIHKFGQAADFDTGDNIVTIWDGADDGFSGQRMRYIYSTGSDIDSVVSDSAGDNQVIEIQGLDGDSLPLTQSVTLNGQTRVEIGSSFYRVWRMKNTNSTDNAGHVQCYVSGAAPGGVVANGSDIRAIMQPENNQTLMAVYTIPNGYTGYMRDWYASTAGANRAANYDIRLKARPSGGVFQLKHLNNLQDGGTSYIQHKYTDPEKFTSGTDIEMTAEIKTGAITTASISAGFGLILISGG